MEWNADRRIGIGGIAVTTVLLVLDKAGKLKGPLLLVLLAGALCMTLPILFSIPWVSNSPAGVTVFTRRALMVAVAGLVWALLSVWVTQPDQTKRESVINPVSTEFATTPEVKKLNLELTPHSESASIAYVEAVNKGETAKFRAQIRIIGRSDGEVFKKHAYRGLWINDISDWVVGGGAWWMDTVRPTDEVRIQGNRNSLLVLASIEQGYEPSQMSLVGIPDESIEWRFSPQTAEQLPFFDLRIEFSSDGYPTIMEEYRVGPKTPRGPLQIVEI